MSTSWPASTDAEFQRIATVSAMLEAHFPQVHEGGRVTIARLVENRTQLVVAQHPSQLRPGGIISGPTIFKAADLALYVILLGDMGDAALGATTTNLNISFMRPLTPGDFVAEARVFKRGRRLAFGDISIGPEGGGSWAAHATATYAIPS